MSKNKDIKMTLRQRLRNDSEKKLEKIIYKINDATKVVLEDAGTNLNWQDVIRLAGSMRSKSLKTQLITQLANEAEDELERLYNNQQTLSLEKKDAA